MVDHDQLLRFGRALSRAAGWIYTLLWSLSFYPQPILNWQRRSTQGFTIDFPTLNVLGFFCYSTSTCFFLYSSTIRQQYAARHPLAPEPTVRFNDAAFGIHAVIIVLLTYSQFFPALWGFKGSDRARTSRPVLGIFWGSVIAIIAVSGLVYFGSAAHSEGPQDWEWIDVLYTLGYVKLLSTFVKYIPQVWMNYRRQSTQGWSIAGILFDITGGVLSLLQLVIDASFQGDWSGITGNPLKLGLANISIAFDLIFIAQHYILYRDKPDDSMKETEDDAERPLLGH
ncbi:hypothetical protein LTR84_002154 [Exophiala bonariae]|uniref:L-cystine transporter-like protein n=1 Tax=Exophiala bonariae TaxID=1690606 RepID=A0AAV9NF42_9EURO|nr:hypothetical protein LTR84_002154 [Exophiala bonariae]